MKNLTSILLTALSPVIAGHLYVSSFTSETLVALGKQVIRQTMGSHWGWRELPRCLKFDDQVSLNPDEPGIAKRTSRNCMNLSDCQVGPKYDPTRQAVISPDQTPPPPRGWFIGLCTSPDYSQSPTNRRPDVSRSTTEREWLSHCRTIPYGRGSMCTKNNPG